MADNFWTNVETYLDAATSAPNTDALITLTLDSFDNEKHGEDAFFPGSGGDRQLIDSLELNPSFAFVWIEAEYHWQARDRDGSEIRYLEGDLRLNP